MPNIMIDEVQATQWTGTMWVINGRVQAETAGQHTANFTVEVASLAPATLNAAIKDAAIDAIEAAGAGTVGVLDAKTIIGGAVTL